MPHISEHFTLKELTRSATALRHGVSNLPAADTIDYLRMVANYILEPVRAHFNIPYSPSSAYRSLAVNKLEGSSPTSQHVMGQAADFELPTISNRDLAEWIKTNLVFDQLILEFYNENDPKSGWVHCSYHEGNNRNQSLIFDGSTFKEF